MPTIDYAQPGLLRPPHTAWWSLALGLAGIAGGGGLVILCAYGLTEKSSWQLAGFLWLLLGGVMTVGACVVGFIYARAARSCGFIVPATLRRARSACLVPLAVVPIAALCIASGLALAGRASRALILTNRGAITIDALEVSEAGRPTQHAGPLKPGRAIRPVAWQR